MKLTRRFWTMLCVLSVLLALPGSVRAAETSEYWQMDNGAYLVHSDHSLTLGKASVAQYLREINAYAGYETYIDLQDDGAEYGDRSIVLGFDAETGEATVRCGSAVALTEAQRDRIAQALSNGDTAAEQVCAALTELTHCLFDDAQDALPTASYLYGVVAENQPLMLEWMDDKVTIEANGLLTEQEVLQLHYQFDAAGENAIIEILPSGTEDEVLAAVNRRLLTLQGEDAADTSVYVYTADNGLLGRDPGTVETVGTENDIVTTLLTHSDHAASEAWTLRSDPNFGLYLVLACMAVLLVAFAVAMHLRRQTKARKNEPVRPGSVTAGAPYAFYVEPVVVDPHTK